MRNLYNYLYTVTGKGNFRDFTDIPLKKHEHYIFNDFQIYFHQFFRSTEPSLLVPTEWNIHKMTNYWMHDDFYEFGLLIVWIILFFSKITHQNTDIKLKNQITKNYSHFTND